MKICIDAGHNYSSYDTGATGNGLREQDVTFKIADRLKELLVNTNIGVTMTRAKITDNVGINAKDAINERARLANSTKCDYFVSIHCNSHTDKNATGTETLIYAKGGRAESLAKAVNEKIVKHFGLRDRGIKVRPDLGVLRLTNMPAILVETAFISNAKDAELLRSRTDEFAECVYKGICEYIGIDAVALKDKLDSAVEIVEKLSGVIEITDKKAAVYAVEKAKTENSSLYWILYKLVNR